MKLDQAIEKFQRSAAINPQYAEAHFNLALAYTELHDCEKAIREYKKTIKTAPSFLPAHANLALLYLRMETAPQAARQLTRALKLAEDQRNGEYTLMLKRELDKISSNE